MMGIATYFCWLPVFGSVGDCGEDACGEFVSVVGVMRYKGFNNFASDSKDFVILAFRGNTYKTGTVSPLRLISADCLSLFLFVMASRLSSKDDGILKQL